MPRFFFALVLLSSACTAFGAATNDSGSSGDPADASATSSGGGPEAGAGTYCDQVRRDDPTVKLCLDFDDETAKVPFGAHEMTDAGDQYFERGPSFLPDAGDALTAGLRRGKGERNAYLAFRVFDASNTPKDLRRVVLDVDLVVERFELDYAVLAGLGLLGKTCSYFTGLSVAPAGLLLHVPEKKPRVGSLEPGTPVHMTLEVESESRALRMLLDHTEVANLQLDDADNDCDTLDVMLGTYFTNVTDREGEVRARFDRVVFRVVE